MPIQGTNTRSGHASGHNRPQPRESRSSPAHGPAQPASKWRQTRRPPPRLLNVRCPRPQPGGRTSGPRPVHPARNNWPGTCPAPPPTPPTAVPTSRRTCANRCRATRPRRSASPASRPPPAAPLPASRRVHRSAMQRRRKPGPTHCSSQAHSASSVWSMAGTPSTAPDPGQPAESAINPPATRHNPNLAAPASSRRRDPRPRARAAQGHQGRQRAWAVARAMKNGPAGPLG